MKETKYYKITFNMRTPIAFLENEPPVFDSVLAYCMFTSQKKVSECCHSIVGDEVADSDKKFFIPLRKHEKDFYLCSKMLYDGKIESIERWKKSWNSRNDSIADFGNSMRRINRGSGQFKDYFMPMSVHSVKQVYFYFAGHAENVAELIENYLYGIGKKVKIGFGWFNDFSIDEIHDEEEKKFVFIRPLPISMESEIKQMGIDYSKKSGAFKLPYWYDRNCTNILYPTLN